MDGQADLPVTEFEKALGGLEGLTRDEILALVVARVENHNERAFAALTENLSLETFRIASARALVAARFASLAYAVMAGPALPSRRARGGGGRSSRRAERHTSGVGQPSRWALT
jgi:hypothetical protein